MATVTMETNNGSVIYD